MTRKPVSTKKETKAAKETKAVKEEPKDSSLDALVSSVKKTLGPSLTTLKDVELWIPTGIPRLDLALGGGLPVGRLTTLIGKKSVGKSTFTVHMLAQIQKMGGLAVGLDAERANLRSRCLAQGIDESRFITCKPESLDTFDRENFKTGVKETVKGAFAIMEDLMKTIYRKSPETIVGVVLDSVAGSSVASELEAEYGKAGMGKHARVLSQAFRKIMPMVEEMNTCFILVNQLKEKIGVMFGSPTTYIGKNPIDFHSTITMEMVQGGYFPEKSSEPEGIITKIWVSKNKVARPFAKTQYVTWFDRGIDVLWECIDFLYKDIGAFVKTAGYLEWDGKKYRQRELYKKAVEDSKLSSTFIKMAQEAVNEQLQNNSISLVYLDTPVSPADVAKG